MISTSIIFSNRSPIDSDPILYQWWYNMKEKIMYVYDSNADRYIKH